MGWKRGSVKRFSQQCQCGRDKFGATHTGVCWSVFGFSNQYLRFPLQVEGIDYLNIEVLEFFCFIASIHALYWYKTQTPSIHLKSNFQSVVALFLILLLYVIYTKSQKDYFYSDGLQANLVSPRSIINSVQCSFLCPQPAAYCLLKKYNPLLML